MTTGLETYYFILPDITGTCVSYKMFDTFIINYTRKNANFVNENKKTLTGKYSDLYYAYTMLGFPDKLWRLTLIKHLAVYR